MPALYKNNATAPIAAGISSSTTTIVLSSGLGTLFPLPTAGSYFYGTLYDSLGNYEIVKCTARTTDSLTVVRGQEGTTPLAFSIGDSFAQRLTAAGLTNFAQLDSDNIFSGNNTLSGDNVLSGDNTFSGSNTFSGAVSIPSGISSPGIIKQIVTQRYTNSTQTTSSSYIDTFNTVTITPTSTSSKIILFAGTMAAFWNYPGAAKVRMIRNTPSNIVVGDQWLWASNGFSQAPYQTYTSMNLHGVDSPATTAAVTYKIQLAAYSSGPTGTAMYGAYDVDGTIFTAIEVLQ